MSITPGPGVCLIVNSFNSSVYIKDTLDALLAQTYRNFKILCVDNVSTDDTYAILKEYAAIYPQIILHQMQKHCRLVDARNFAIERVAEMSGIEYFGFCDSDDLWKSEWLKNLISINNGSDVLFSNGTELHEKYSIEIPVANCFASPRRDAFSSPIHLQSALFSRRLIGEDAFFDSNLEVIYDLDHFLKLQKIGCSYVHTSKELFCYRVHSNSVSQTRFWQIFKERWIITKKFKLPVALFLLKYALTFTGVYALRRLVRRSRYKSLETGCCHK